MLQSEASGFGWQFHSASMMTLLSTINLNILIPGTLLFLAYALRHLGSSARRKRVLPPGPEKKFLLGNLLDMPKTKPWEVFHEWGKKYGDIMHLHALRDDMIILTSYESISELLEQRSSIYSDRKCNVMMNDYMGLGNTTGMLPYGPIWRKHRKIFNQQLNAFAVSKLESQQSEACIGLLNRLLETPQNFDKHLSLCASQIVMGITYDRKIASAHDEILVMNERNVVDLSIGLQPGHFLVDLFPALRYIPEWFPGVQFKKFGKETSKRWSYIKETQFNDLKARMVSGTARSCLVMNVLSRTEDDESEEEGENGAISEDNFILKELAASLFIAASATTVSTLKGSVVAMVLNPDVQVKAQRELDTVLQGFGRPRLPTFADQSSLPYTTALIKEVLRWFPATPLALPHFTSADDIYKGYFIPKGTIILANAWSVLRDPNIYEKPFEFRPERFLANENNGVIEKDPAAMGAFGYGRRICPGRFLAEKTLWLVIASMLTVFKFDYAVDEETGERIDVRKAFDFPPGLLCEPNSFRCSIKPRSEQHQRLVQSISLN